MSSDKGGKKAPQKLWTPSNVITVVRICLVPVFVAALLTPWPEWWHMPAVTNDVKCIVAAVLFVIISGTDWLDGYLARHRNEVTDFGKFMDPLADKILVTAALIALVELNALPTWVVLVILAREFIISGLRMMAAAKGVVIAASYLGKFKTVFQMIAIVLFTIKDIWKSLSPDSMVPEAMYVFSWIVMGIALVLTVVSLIDYIAKAREVIGLGGNVGESEPEYEMGAALSGMAQEIVDVAASKSVKVGTAESLTGGLIGKAITAIPGASDIYAGGIVSYTNPVKEKLLGVPEEILDSVGAVSEECAIAMAQGARKALGCDIAVSVTGIAGPTGAEPGKPVGTVWIGIADEQDAFAQLRNFEGERGVIRVQTAIAALEALEARINRSESDL